MSELLSVDTDAGQGPAAPGEGAPGQVRRPLAESGEIPAGGARAAPGVAQQGPRRSCRRRPHDQGGRRRPRQDGAVPSRHPARAPGGRGRSPATPRATCSACSRSTRASRAYNDYERDAARGRPRRGRDRDAVARPRGHGPRGARARPARVLREAASRSTPRDAEALTALAERARRWSPRSATTTASSAPSARSSALLDAGAIGEVTHVLGEAYGPVVLKPKGGTWRSRAAEGGGCLYDYAAHPINLLNWYLGEPTGVGGHRAQPHLLARDRRRGLRHPLLPRRRRARRSRSTGPTSPTAR